MLKRLAMALFCCCAIHISVGTSSTSGAESFVEAEGFRRCGGWVVDPQFLDVMGSPYLLAHGLGTPVDDARSVIKSPQAGRYQVWVRTKDWVPAHHPGTFRVVVGGQELPTVFGNQGEDWSWQQGDVVELPRGDVELGLRDLTGFDGRCDALYLTTDLTDDPPPNSDVAL